eukprot:m51a1_g4109 hypothetical protein (475) ;mRNA; r:123387-125578
MEHRDDLQNSTATPLNAGEAILGQSPDPDLASPEPGDADVVVGSDPLQHGPDAGPSSGLDMTAPYSPCLPCSRGLGNVVVLGVAFFFAFVGYNVAQNFASSVHGQLGFIECSVVNFMLGASSVFAPAAVGAIGEKLVMMIGVLMVVPFPIFNMWHNAVALIGSSMVAGIGLGLMWIAQGFFAIMQAHQLVGNLAGQVVKNTFGLKGLYSCLAVAAFLAFPLLFLLRIPTFPRKQSNKNQQSLKSRLLATVSAFKDKRMVLISIFVLYHGTTVPFMFGVFPLLAGPNFLGYAMAVFGAFNVVMSLTTGKVSDIVGKRPVVCFGAVCMVIATSLSWLSRSSSPHPSETLTFMSKCLLFITGGLLGSVDAVNNTQIFSVIGLFYTEETAAVAFAARFLVLSLTMGLWFFLSAYVPFVAMVVIVDLFAVVSVVVFFLLDRISPIDSWRAEKSPAAIESVALVPSAQDTESSNSTPVNP